MKESEPIQDGAPENLLTCALCGRKAPWGEVDYYADGPDTYLRCLDLHACDARLQDEALSELETAWDQTAQEPTPPEAWDGIPW